MEKLSKEMIDRIENDFAYHKAGEEQIALMGEVRSRCKSLATFLAENMIGLRVKSEVVSMVQDVMFKANANIVGACPIDSAKNVEIVNMPPESKPVVGTISAPKEVKESNPEEVAAVTSDGLDLTKTKFNKNERALIKTELRARGVTFDESQRSAALAKKLVTARLSEGVSKETTVQQSAPVVPAVTEAAPVISEPVTPTAPAQAAAPVTPAKPEPVIAAPVQPAAPVQEAPATITLEEVQKVVSEYYNTMGEPKTIELLTYFGAQKVSALQPQSYGQIVKMAQDQMAAAMNAGAGILG